MNRLHPFDDHSHRCLFQNECVQAHLLGLKARCPCFEACFPHKTTVIVTYGQARAQIAGRDTEMRAGDQVEVPQACVLRLMSDDEADVMLLLKPGMATRATPALPITK